MNTTTLNSFNILDRLSFDLSIQENKYNIELDSLMTIGARINPKRSFLFISKLLGKHLEVNPIIPKLAGHLLSNLYTDFYHKTNLSDVPTLIKALDGDLEGVNIELNKQFTLPKPVLFIGFAETATGLGHGVFSAFNNGYYTHTTREQILDMNSIFNFEEEHSHATGHSCFLLEKTLFDVSERIVLIDDEITTGKTALNLMKEINKHLGVKKFTVLSLLDWRTKEWIDYQKQFCIDNDIEVDILSLISGEIIITKEYTFEDTFIKEEPLSYPTIPMVSDISFSGDSITGNKLPCLTSNGSIDYSIYTGRFGMPSDYNRDIEEISSNVGFHLSAKRKSPKTLVIGMGEFIYIPSRIASYMGEDVFYKSSTRSPIFCDEAKDYPINSRIQFKLSDIQYYLYNMKDNFDEIFIIHENPIAEEDKHEIISQLALCSVKYINFYKF